MHPQNIPVVVFLAIFLVACTPQTRGNSSTVTVTSINDTAKHLAEPPQVVQTVAPKYPADIKRSKIEGTVMVDVIVDETGAVILSSIASSSNVSLSNAAIEAVRQWKYQPYIVNAAPIKVRFRQPISFKLTDSKQGNGQF